MVHELHHLTRPLGVALVSAIASFPGILAHTIEDFLHGVPSDFGVSSTAGAWLIAMAITIHVGVLATAAARPSQPTVVAIAAYGIGWVIAAIADHPGAFGQDAFREGPSSRLWVFIVVLGQLTAAIAAITHLVRTRRQEAWR